MKKRGLRLLSAVGIIAATCTAPAFAAGPSTTRVSVGQSGRQADAFSSAPVISADGRFVAFTSAAGNLVRHDTNGVSDAFVRDTVTGRTRLVSVGLGGDSANGMSFAAAISANGRYIAFDSFASNLVRRDRNGVQDAFVRDLLTGRIQQVTVGLRGPSSGGGSQASISSDGRLVAFSSWSADIVANDTNSTGDVFVRNLRTGVTVRVSVASNGDQSDPPPPPPVPPYGSERYSSDPAISGNGQAVAFASRATNFVAGDTNASSDVFVHYLSTGVTAMVSVKPDGSPAGPGYHGGGSSAPSISANGRIIAFSAIGGGLVDPPLRHMSDCYVRDMRTGVTQLAEVTLDGSQATNGTYHVSLSPDGRYVAFSSQDSNLVLGDRNGTGDVFVRDLLRNQCHVA